MDDSKLPAGRSSHGSRFNDRVKNEHTYANGGIHHLSFEVDRLRSERHFHQTNQKVNVLNFNNQGKLENSDNATSLPRISMSFTDDKKNRSSLSLSPSLNTSVHISRQSEKRMDSLRHVEGESSNVNHSYITSDQDNNEIPSDLKCSMCQREYIEPRILPCLHSFCLRCLEEEVEHRTENRIRCPKCQRDFDLGVSTSNYVKYKYISEIMFSIYRVGFCAATKL